MLRIILAISLAAFSQVVIAQSYEAELDRIGIEIADSVEANNMTAAVVLDFADLEGRVSQLGRFLSTELSSVLVNSSNGFNIIDRANLEKIMSENELQRSGLVDPDGIRRLGAIIPASALIIGTFTPLGDTLRLQVRVIDMETAEILSAARGNLEFTSDLKSLSIRVFEDAAAANLQSRSQLNEQQVRDTVTSPSPASLVRATLNHEIKVIDAVYNQRNESIIVNMEFTNLEPDPLCIAHSGTQYSELISNEGDIYENDRLVGIKLLPNAPPRYGFSNSYLARDYTVITSEQPHRFSVAFPVEHLDSTNRFALSLNLVRGDTPTDMEPSRYNYRYRYNENECASDSPPELIVSFSGIAPRL